MTEHTFAAPRVSDEPPTLDPFTGDPDLDPDLAPLEDEGEVSDLDAIAAEFAEEEAAEAEILVDGRPGWSIVCRTDFTLAEVEGLKPRAKDPKFRKSGGVNPAKHAALLLGVMCLRIRRGGRDVVLDDQVVTFGSASFQQAMGLHQGAGVFAAVMKLYGGSEGRVIAASDRLMEEAGWGTEADLADPTG